MRRMCRSLVRVSIIIPLYLAWRLPSPGQVFGQEWADPTSAQPVLAQGSSVKSEVSPGALEMARLLGIEPLGERLIELRNSTETIQGDSVQNEQFRLRQEITEAVMTASLEVDGVFSEIDYEIAQVNEALVILESRRDHALAVNTIANFLTAGGMGIASSLLQMHENTAILGNAIGASSGGLSILLSVVGIHQQRGGRRAPVNSPNMLARIFDREPEFHSEYPEIVWAYLNAVPPNVGGTETRRQQLIREWTEEGRLGKPDSAATCQKIEYLASGRSSGKALSIDLLLDRAAMLQDVRAQTSLMKRDLSRLMATLRPR